MTHSRWLLLLCACALAAAPSARSVAQSMENYQQQKKAEKAEPNRFLKGETLEKSDQLSRYYRRAFSDQQSFKGFTFESGKEKTALSGQEKSGGVLPLEGPIDPAQYRLGPMDMLAINLWGDMPSMFNAVVTPEGSVLVPAVGEISVRNMSLLDAKAVIIREVKKQYARATVTVTLLAPRAFIVHVSGMVAAPGAYEASAVDRAEKLIAMANITTAAEAEKTSNRYLEDPERNISFEHPNEQKKPDMSMRNIRILRGGDTLGVDLLRFYAAGDLRANPQLLDGDVIVAPPEQLENNSVSITGAVRLPGSFEYRAGDSLGLMVRIAQGFKENAIVDSIEVLRVSGDGATLERLIVNGRTLATGGDIALRPNDRVLVRERQTTSRTASIVIRGEVQRPGSYPITLDATTASQALAMAGGFTAIAAQAEVMILRHDPNQKLDPLNAIPDYQRLTDIRLSGMNKEEREYFTFEDAIRRNTVALDARRLFLEGDRNADITLRDGDEIVVPSSQNTVYVFGQVPNPGHVTHVPGMNMKYYLARAGGVADDGVKGDIKIIKAGSKNWLDPGDTPIEPGDAIWVPREPDRDFFFYFTAVRDFLQVSVSIATVYLLFVQIKK